MKSLTDVLILGGGIVGCAVADELSRRGVRVTLADPRGIGHGATQASAGMLAPFTEGLHDPVLQTLGSESLEPVALPGWDLPVVERSGGNVSLQVPARSGAFIVVDGAGS